MKNLNLFSIFVVAMIISFLIFTLFPNNFIYADGILEKMVTLGFTLYIIKRSWDFLEKIYYDSHIIDVLEVE